MVEALATELILHINLLNISRKLLRDEALIGLLEDIGEQCLLLIEDIAVSLMRRLISSRTACMG